MSVSQAQNLYSITSSTPLEDNWPPSDSVLMKALSHNAGYEQAWTVRLGHVPSLQAEAGEVGISLPLPGMSGLIFKTVTLNFTDSGNYFYNGRVVGGESSTQNIEMFLNCYEGRVIASIVSDAGNFDLLPTSTPGVGVLLLYRADAAEGEHCGNEGASRVSAPLTAHGPDPTPGICVVDLVVFVTPLARQIEPTINDRIRLNVEVSNQILCNGQIDNRRAFRLVGIENIGWVERQNSMSSDLRDLSRLPEVVQGRQRASADFAVFVTGATASNSTQNYPNIFGIAQDLARTPNAWAAIVKTGEAMAARMTFTHELAHLLDCHHDYAYESLYNNAFIFTYTYPPQTSWIRGPRSFEVSTVVSAGSIRSRIPYFSNPSVRVWYGNMRVVPGGDYTNGRGLTWTGNNNLRVAETFCLAANRVKIETLHCPEPCPRRVSIEPNRSACPCSPSSLGLNWQDSIAPQHILWEKSSNGIHYTAVGTGPIYYYNRPCKTPESAFFRVTATFTNGYRAQAFYTDHAAGPPNATYTNQAACSSARMGSDLASNIFLEVIKGKVHYNTTDLQTPLQIAVYSSIGQQLATYVSLPGTPIVDLRSWKDKPVFIRCRQGNNIATLRILAQ